MRISATGKVRAQRDSGFTLVELLIVLTIIGLLSAVVVLALPSKGGGLGGEATRFAARAKALQDKAIIDSRATSIVVGPGGYAVQERAEGEWRPMRGVPATQVPWEAGTTALLPYGEERIVFSSTGAEEASRIVLQRDGTQIAIDVLPGGDVQVAR